MGLFSVKGKKRHYLLPFFFCIFVLHVIRVLFDLLQIWGEEERSFGESLPTPKPLLQTQSINIQSHQQTPLRLRTTGGKGKMHSPAPVPKSKRATHKVVTAKPYRPNVTPKWTVASTEIPLVVVEEHQDVLRPWFQLAAVRGASLNVPLNATLVHVDPHSVMAQGTRGPRSAWPSDLNAIRNQVGWGQYLMYAVRRKLFQKIVMVWPQWVAKKYRQKQGLRASAGTRIEHRLGVGVYRPAVLGGEEPEEYACRCVDGRCQVNDHVSYMDNSSLCVIEAITTQVILAPGNDPEWVSAALGAELDPLSPVVLDVDEDYVGIADPEKALERAGNRKGVLQRLAATLEGTFCAQPPHGASKEQAVDLFLRGLLNMVLAFKGGVQALGASSKLIELEIADLRGGLWGREDGHDPHVWQRLVKVVTSYSNRKARSVQEALCTPQTMNGTMQAISSMAVKFVWRLLRYVAEDGIRALAECGFCTDTGEFPQKLYNINFCVASPWAGHEIQYEPAAPSEASWQLRRLLQIFRLGLTEAPQLITVSRSVRSGYTPRHLWNATESTLLAGLEQLLGSHRRRLNVSIDEGCYWGAHGVASRSEEALDTVLL